MSCIFPGSFDPPTAGHVELAERAIKIFGGVTVALLVNPRKQPLFSVEDRVKLLGRCMPKDAVIVTHSGLLWELAAETGIKTILRGVRSEADVAYEMTQARLNRRLMPELETVLLPASPALADISSAAVRELLLFGGDAGSLLPGSISEDVIRLFKSV